MFQGLHESSYVWRSSCVPYRTEEEGSRRTAGGEKEAKQVERIAWRRRRLPGGLAWLYAGRNRRNKESLRHSFFFFQPLPSHLPFLHICSHCSFPPLSSPSSCPCSYYLSSSSFPIAAPHILFTPARVFLNVLWRCRLFTGNEPGRRSVPARFRLCCLPGVGVKTRTAAPRAWEMAPHRIHCLQNNMQTSLFTN